MTKVSDLANNLVFGDSLCVIYSIEVHFKPLIWWVGLELGYCKFKMLLGQLHISAY